MSYNNYHIIKLFQNIFKYDLMFKESFFHTISCILIKPLNMINFYSTYAYKLFIYIKYTIESQIQCNKKLKC